jgi:hypothetical protein
MTKLIQERIRALRNAEHQMAPRREWMNSTRALLVSKVTRDLAQSAVVERAAPQNVSTILGEWFRRPALAAISFLAIALGGSIFSVSSAEQSKPGDALYGLRLATEQARLAMTTDSEDKLKLKAEFTGRRMDDLKTAVENKDAKKVAEVAESLKRDLTTLNEQLHTVAGEKSSTKTASAAKLVDEQTNKMINILQIAKEQVPADAKEKVTEIQLAAADASVKAIKVLAEKHEEANDVVSEQEVTQAIQDHVKAVETVTSSTLALPLASSTLVGTSSTAVTSSTMPMVEGASSTTSLPDYIDQIQDATVQAFELQKTKDKLEAASSTTEGATETASSSTSDTSAASSTQPSATTTEGVTSTPPST